MKPTGTNARSDTRPAAACIQGACHELRSRPVIRLAGNDRNASLADVDIILKQHAPVRGQFAGASLETC
jgi:hypothetical protein